MRDRHVLPQGKVQANPAQAAMQQLTPVGTSSQPGPWWLIYSLGQQLYEPLHISMLAHYCCSLFYRAPERRTHPGAGAGLGISLAPQCLTHPFQRGGFLGGVICSSSLGPAAVTPQAAPREAGRLRATGWVCAPRHGLTGVNLSGMETAECARIMGRTL